MLTELSGVEAMHLVSTEGPRRMIQLNIWVSYFLTFLLLFVFASYSPKWGNATTWLVLRRDAVVVGRQTLEEELEEESTTHTHRREKSSHEPRWGDATTYSADSKSQLATVLLQYCTVMGSSTNSRSYIGDYGLPQR